MSGGLHDLTLTELANGLSAKKFSSREIADALLGRIEKADGKLHAFTEVYAKEARAMADAADTARATGFPLGPLHGLPMAYKDLCDIKGRVGTGGSKMWDKRIATERWTFSPFCVRTSMSCVTRWRRTSYTYILSHGKMTWRPSP